MAWDKYHTERERSNKEIIHELENMIKDYASHNKTKVDALSKKTLEKLKSYPTVWYRSEREIKQSEFLLRGLICRLIDNTSNRNEHLKLLDKLRFYR